MSKPSSIALVSLCVLSVGRGVPGARAQAVPTQQADNAGAPADIGWPRTFHREGDAVVMYQPQVDDWKDYSKIRFRAALAVTLTGEEEASYGVLAVQADTLVDHDAGTVIVTNMDGAVRFPDCAPAKAATLKSLVNELLAKKSFVSISLARVLAYMHDAPKPPTVAVNMTPPPIYYSDGPAVLVNFLGQPQFRPIKDTTLMFAVNTNWVVLMDTQASQYYLLNGDSWLKASDPSRGPWAAAGSLPASFSSLPEGSTWDEIRKHVPGSQAKSVPYVFVSTEPAELIVTNGPPAYTPIDGTRLMFVSNPTMPLFLDLAEGNYYFLVSGRWFRAKDVVGPWSAASSDLPSEFALIPPASPMGYVLASVPGTQDARDSVILASVPHTASVNTKDAALNVVYDGAPKFAAIDGTGMKYAVNTAYEVVASGGQFYCCYQGVWFASASANGPWAVCTSVPTEIYTIPPGCPIYNVTYVRVYSTTPTTVVVGYTAGYSGEYVASNGALMFGAGMLTGAVIASQGSWYPCTPCYYSYGCGAVYYPAYGCYCRGATLYGPHGGAGWGAAYHPSTGTWSRAAYAYGPAGAATVRQAYNPFTNTYAGHATATNGYESWGASTVSQGNKWATAAHTTNAEGVTRGWAESSSGNWAKGVSGPNGNAAVATSNGDVYAGHDGNVYRKTDDGQWQTHQNGGWQDMNAAKPATPAPLPAQAPAQATNRFGNGAAATPAVQPSTQDSWKSNWNSGDWKNNFESGGWGNRWGGGGQQGLQSGGGAQGFGGGQQGNSLGGGGGLWGNHDVQSGLNQDSWARGAGSFGGGGSSWGGGGGGGRFGGGRRR